MSYKRSKLEAAILSSGYFTLQGSAATSVRLCVSAAWSCQDCIKMTLQLCNYRARWFLTFPSLFVLYAAILFDCFVAAWNRDVATVPVAPIDLKVNLAAGSEF